MMPRSLLIALVVGLFFCVVPLHAQTGSITGRVTDATTLQPITSANVILVGTTRGTLTGANGSFVLTGVPAGTHRVMASLIGYGSLQEEVTVTAGAAASVNFSMQPQAVALEQLVATGYGTQRRLAISGSVAVVNADEANVGVTSNANELIQGRVAGVHMTVNNGEPGAGAQIRIRGGTSISASNEPLYVIDGVPISTVSAEAGGFGIGGEPALGRSPLSLLNPSDIESITILKDASASAIYGARGANGVVLIQTKKGGTGGVSMEYDGYVATSSRARSLEVLTGSQYRQFIQENLPGRVADLGQADTDWEDALTRNAITHNHNLTFSGGSASTRYRASLNYMDQEGVVLSSGFERLQGRLSGSHSTWSDRLRLNLNLTGSHIDHDYLPFEAGGGFEGGVFVNMAIYDPTRPVSFADPVTGQQRFFEVGGGSQSIRNPVALAEQIQDFASTSRILGNTSAALDILPGLTGQVNLGVDRTEGTRRIYFPLSSPVGADFGGMARQVNRDNTAITFQGLLTARRTLADVHSVEVVGGYEYSDFDLGEFGVARQGFSTDAFGFNNLLAGTSDVNGHPFSWRQESRGVSFFTRANYSLKDRYFIAGVVRRDGSSRFGSGNKWATFPALSASWRINEESFLKDGPFSDLRLRVGWGKQGNEAVPAYASLILLETQSGARYIFGDEPIIGVAPVRNPNPNLKWEETKQWNFAIDYGFAENRFTGSLEYYLKDTDDLLLEVNVPQPAVVATRLENIGRIRNRGLEGSLDARVLTGTGMNWTAGLVFSAERNEVVDLGGRTFITTGGVSGQGQSGQVSQRIIPGEPLGTFYGPVFLGVNTAGKQEFKCTSTGATDTGCVGGRTTVPRADDYEVIGNANSDFSVGVRSQLTWNNFDASFLVRAEVGRDVFNNTALVYATKSNATQGRNFLASALDDPTAFGEPAIFSSRWIEDGSFARLQNITIGYTFDLPGVGGRGRRTRAYLSGDNLLLLTDYSGYDPEVHATRQDPNRQIDPGNLAVRGIDYLVYPRARTITAGVRVAL